ncbi:MAG: type IX secretion system membrane protein PorP/SprF [Bacteroidetes bacterium]|nr:type IX secretion system membrane protein PorP/SprF [Bacteroidota bacterium]
MKNKIITALFLSMLCLKAQAQQDPMYTHYMYNTLSINPAYAGSRDALTITALHRSQWVDYKGAPLTQTLTLHSPILSKHIGLGLSASNDKIGPINNTMVNGSFAYIMQLNKKSKLALGLSGGVNILQANLSSLSLDQQNDATFSNNTSNRVTPNFGTGAYYSRERFYAGVSVPNLVQSNYSSTENGSASNGKSQRHYFFIAGGVIKLTDNLALKPTTLVKVTEGAPLQTDLTASFIIMKKLLLGAMYRTNDAFGVLVGFDVNEQLHVGYSYDISHGNRTFSYNQGSHEVMLRYDFIFSGKKQIHSPRYF